jgi:DNA topoisomerase-1
MIVLRSLSLAIEVRSVARKRGKTLVIVESPAKAKKISGFLGPNYKVLPSMGHIRDLPAGASQVPAPLKKEEWAKIGVNVEQGFQPLYVVPPEKKKVVSELKAALKDADELILATDEDREGESIGWHLTEVLKPKVPVKRMVFGEITKEAIQEAIQSTRDLDENLVSAQETRRVLDRLYGYRLSPLLWKKIAPKLSAGRVQSVAVRLIVQRELERMAFRSATYWDLKAELITASDAKFTAELASVGGQRVASGKDFDESTGKLKESADVLLLDESSVESLRSRLTGAIWQVRSVKERSEIRRAYPPFTTSTLQQEANRKLGLSSKETMQIAQRLYEDGYITYMRTDSVSLSGEAIGAARRRIDEKYGREYLSPEVRQFTTQAKGAQEAHEAIRPAGKEMLTAEELGLSGQSARLYSLIWMRTMATQMADARLTFITATITADDAEFRATGRHVDFPGFFRAYVEGVDDPEAALDDQEAALPPLAENQPLALGQLDSLRHETKPPARYTEATLVRELESDGIGRPSTYASIISTIQDRGYVRKVGNQLIPTFTAMAVTKLLEQNFPKLVDVKFTAQMEEQLDEVATGQADPLPYLQKFYSGNDGLDEQVRAHEESIDPRIACTIELPGVASKVRVGRYGPFLQKDGEETEPETASIPEDIAPADITNELAEKWLELKKQGPQSIGSTDDGLPIYSLSGRFGPYLQAGDVSDDPEAPKPRRVSIPKSIDPLKITLEQAKQLLSLPRDLGLHPVTQKPVLAGIGRFGPYVVCDRKYKSIPKDQDVLTIDLPAAVELLAQARVKSAATPLRDLGKHPEDDAPVQIFDGRYGPYVRHGDIFASIPKDRTIESVQLDEALIWLAERAAKGPSKKRPRRTGVRKKAASVKDDSATASAMPAKKKAAKKKAAKKKAAKKKAAPKKAAKKKAANKKQKTE